MTKPNDEDTIVSNLNLDQNEKVLLFFSNLFY